MSEQAELRSQATDLRRHGYSYSQIGRRLGVHKSVVARWVATVPFDRFNAESLAEQLSSVRDPRLYNRALELRLAGWSYKMIEAEVGVSRSTLSGWLRNVTFAEYDPRVQQRALAAQTKAVEANKLRLQTLEARICHEATEEIQQLFIDGLTERDLFLTGLMLYWAEGGKAQRRLRVSNSDPGIVKTLVVWLERCLNVAPEQLRAEVHLYPDVNINDAEVYWSTATGIPRSQFHKAQVDRRQNKSVEKHGKLPYGTIHVKVLGQGTSNLHRRIMGWIASFREYTEQVSRD